MAGVLSSAIRGHVICGAGVENGLGRERGAVMLCPGIWVMCMRRFWATGGKGESEKEEQKLSA